MKSSLRHSNSPVHIATLRESFLGQIGMDYQTPAPDEDKFLQECQAKWKSIAGAIAQFSHPISIKNSTLLVVEIKHSAYLADFQFYRGNIEVKLKEMSQGRIKSIQVKYKP